MSRPPEFSLDGEILRRRHGLPEPPAFSVDFLRQRTRAGAEKRRQEQQRKFELALARWMEEFQEASEIAADQGEAKCRLKTPLGWRREIEARLTDMGFNVQVERNHERNLAIEDPYMTISW